MRLPLEEPTLSLNIIVKDSSEAEQLETCIKSAKKYVDKIYVTNTHQPSIGIIDICKKHGAIYSWFKWNNNFSDARNFNFRQSDCDYILWLDSDDILEVNVNRYWDGNIKSLLKNEINIYVVTYQYHFDELGNCDVEHYKSRIVKNDGSVLWVGSFHEDFMPMRSLETNYLSNITVIHKKTNWDESNERNLEIAKEDLKTKSKDPRTYWNLGNAYIFDDPAKAEKYYLKFLDFDKASKEEKFLVWMRLSTVIEDDQRLKCILAAIDLRPEYPDGWFRLGEHYYKHGQWTHAKGAMETGFGRVIPKFKQIVWNPLDYTFNPWLQYAKILIELKEDNKAIIYLEKCKEVRDTRAIKALIKTLRKDIAKIS